MSKSKWFKYLLFEDETNRIIEYKAENNNNPTWWGIYKWQEGEKPLDFLD